MNSNDLNQVLSDKRRRRLLKLSLALPVVAASFGLSDIAFSADDAIEKRAIPGTD